VRPIAKGDIHLTLVPPWNEHAVPNAIEKLRRTADKSYGFRLRFGHVGYGPNPKWPRLLWVECDACNELIILHSALHLLPHVTLARIRSNGARIAGKCPIDKDIDLAQEISTVELM
jgi:2'-5' RNA ligase